MELLYAQNAMGRNHASFICLSGWVYGGVEMDGGTQREYVDLQKTKAPAYSERET